MTIEWLASAEGQTTIEALRGTDPMQARRQFPGLRVEQVTAALTQARHKPLNYPLPLVTAEGIQQATPIPVATRRAQRLALTTDTIIDAGCGIGVDAWAFQQAGLQVLAYERDPQTAAIAQANGIEVILADATEVALPDLPLYVDPARRKAHRHVSGQAIRTNDPTLWSPPFDWVLAHASLARVGPGLQEIPSDTEWHCSSINRSLVDATVWFPPRNQLDRRASILHKDTWHEVAGPAAAVRIEPVGDYLLDPDPAIVRAGLVSNIGALIDPHLAFVTCQQAPAPWLGRAMRVLEEVPLKAVSQACRRLGLQTATVWARGFSPVPRLGVREGTDGVVVLARMGPQRVTRACVGVPVART